MSYFVRKKSRIRKAKRKLRKKNLNLENLDGLVEKLSPFIVSKEIEDTAYKLKQRTRLKTIESLCIWNDRAIKYDNKEKREGYRNSIQVFKEKKGICGEKNILFYTMAKALNLKPIFVSVPEHSFTIFKLRKRIVKADPTHAEIEEKWNPKEEGDKPALLNEREASSVYWSDSGIDYLEKRNKKMALRTLRKAILLDPFNATALFLLGELYKERGWKKKALKLFKLTSEINPSDNDATFYYIGEILEKDGYLKEAKLAYRKSCYSKDADEINFFKMGLFYDKIGKLELAKHWYERCINNNPWWDRENGTIAKAHYKLALIQLNSKDESSLFEARKNLKMYSKYNKNIKNKRKITVMISSLTRKINKMAVAHL